MNESSIHHKNPQRCRMSFLIVVFMGLVSLATSACDAMNERIPDVDKKFSTTELQVNNQMTVIELADIADGLIHDWQPQAYLHEVSFGLTYDGFIRGGVFDYVSKKRFLWHERQAIAQVTFDFENEKVILHAVDVNSSGPSDSRLNLAELEVDIHSIVSAANAQGGTEYCEQVANCFIIAGLDNSVWTVSYGRPGEIIHDLEIKLNAKK
jgi:hypothetical protein